MNEPLDSLHVPPIPLLPVAVVEDTTARPGNLTTALASLVLSRAREHLRHGERAEPVGEADDR